MITLGGYLRLRDALLRIEAEAEHALASPPGQAVRSYDDLAASLRLIRSRCREALAMPETKTDE
ncbi:MAG: hypothetical protein IT429_14845 [Gemmataceae bacterium]|nr:hypothetical protein [Gemmataceae bacterium]